MLTAFGVSGGIVMLYGILAAVMMHQAGWHTPMVVGGTVMTAYLVYLTDRAGLLWDLVIQPVRVPLQYVIYAAIGIIIELIGQHLLGLWSYPAFSPTLELIHVIVFGYPFLFFMTFELYVLIQWLVRVAWLALPLTWLVSVVLHEVPNMAAGQWMYDIPMPAWSIFDLHIIVLIGWVAMLIIPLAVRLWLGYPAYVPRPFQRSED